VLQVSVVASLAAGTVVIGLVSFRRSAALSEASSDDRVAAVYLWGDNRQGLIPFSLKTETSMPYPTPIPFFEGKKIRDISFAEKHAAALDASGNLYQWGAGFQGVDAGDLATLRANGGYLIPKITFSGKKLVSVGCAENATVALSDQVRTRVHGGEICETILHLTSFFLP
jgi:alpha-tubulin suppressor-like RCC1 family protein